MKYEFVLSDQFRQFHFLVGLLLSQLCISLNENKEQRKVAINIFRNIICKHSYDNRYSNDKVFPINFCVQQKKKLKIFRNTIFFF